MPKNNEIAAKQEDNDDDDGCMYGTFKPSPILCNVLPPSQPIAEFTVEELIDEIKRRCIGVVITTVQVGHNNYDYWTTNVKGNIRMLSAIHGSTESKLREIVANLDRRGEGNGAPIDC